MTSPSLRDPRLTQLYQDTPGAVAFVDESYRVNPLSDQRAFYSMSAVTFDKGRLDQVREVLTDIAAGRYWHTTEANQVGRHDDIARMTRYIADQAEWNIVTVETTVQPGDDGVLRARSTCLSAIAREVSRGEGPGAVRLIVADNNRDENVNRLDRQVMERLRATGDISRHVSLYHGRMGREPVLWAADVVSWSAYRNITVDDERWIEPLRDVLTVLDAQTGLAIKMKQPQAAAATPGAQELVPATQRTESQREVPVASANSIHTEDSDPPVAAKFQRGSSVIEDLVTQVAHLRRQAGAQGVIQGNTPEALAARARRLLERKTHDSAPDSRPPATRGPQL